MELPIHLGPTASARLAALGLTEVILHRAVIEGEMHRRSCTKHDPAVMRGVLRWGKTVRSLRDQLCPSGWTCGRDSGYETVDRPDGRLSVVVMTGDAMTGSVADDCTPRSRYPKGAATETAVYQNNIQTRFSFHDPVPSPVAVICETWVLLVHTGADEIRAELSLPASLDSSGRISGWRERIILNAISRNDDPIERLSDDDEDDDIDFDIERRAS